MEFSELSTSAQKMISYLIKNMEYSKDFVYLYNYKMIKEVGLSDTSISLAKNELVEKEWLFKSEKHTNTGLTYVIFALVIGKRFIEDTKIHRCDSMTLPEYEKLVNSVIQDNRKNLKPIVYCGRGFLIQYLDKLNKELGGTDRAKLYLRLRRLGYITGSRKYGYLIKSYDNS